jgi:predicted nuclease with TOPRIM domain
MKRTFFQTTTITRAKAAASKCRIARREASKKGVTLPLMATKDRSESLRNEIEELREEAAALADRAKKTARQAEVLAERIKGLEKEIAKRP